MIPESLFAAFAFLALAATAMWVAWVEESKVLALGCGTPLLLAGLTLAYVGLQ